MSPVRSHPFRALFGAAFILALLALPPATLAAQGGAAGQPQPERLWLRPAIGIHLGFLDPEEAKSAAEWGFYVDVGSLKYERLRLVIGVDRFSSESTRPGADGKFANTSLNADLRYKPFKVSGVAPYFGAGLGVQFRSTDATDPNIAAIYDGVTVGAQAFVGTHIDLDATGVWGLTAELRRAVAQNVNRTGLRLGVLRRL